MSVTTQYEPLGAALSPAHSSVLLPAPAVLTTPAPAIDGDLAAERPILLGVVFAAAATVAVVVLVHVVVLVLVGPTV